MILAILVAGLPIAVQLARQQQLIKSYAKEPVVEFIIGKCVAARGNNPVATCKDPINIRITAPFAPAGVGAQSSKVTSTISKGLMSVIPKGGLVGTVYADKCNPDDEDFAPDCECDNSCGPPPPDPCEGLTADQCACQNDPASCPVNNCENICVNYASDECGNLSAPPAGCGTVPTECSTSCPAGKTGTCGGHDYQDGNGCICETEADTCTESSTTCTIGNTTRNVGESAAFCVTPRQNCPSDPTIGVGADYTCEADGVFRNPINARCEGNCKPPEGSCPTGSHLISTLDPSGVGLYVNSVTIVNDSLQPYTQADETANKPCGYAYFEDTTDYSSAVRYCASDQLKFHAWDSQSACKEEALKGGACTGGAAIVGTCTSANQCGVGTQAYQYTTLNGSTNCTKAQAEPKTCNKTCTSGTCGTDNKCSGGASPSPSSSTQGQTHVFVESESGGVINAGSMVIVTATGSKSCSNNITSPPNVAPGTGYSGCVGNPKGFTCDGTGDRANPKNSDACWWQWTCTAGADTRNYNVSFNAGGNSCQSSTTMTIAAPLVTTTDFRWAENPTDLAKATWLPYTKDQQDVAISFADDTPSKKSVWVEFKLSNNTTQTKIAYIDFVGDDPLLTGIDCNLDSTGAVNIKVKGKNFGKDQGNSRLVVNSSSANIEDWKDSTVSAKLTVAAVGSHKFTVTLNRGDQAPAVSDNCTVGVSQVTLGTKLFCRAPNAVTQNNVNVTLVEDTKGATPVKELVSIDKDGNILGLKTKIQEDKKYKLAVKVPRSLRKVISFTGSSGTTIIPNVNLPIGDISPADGDGIINNADRHELIRQWRLISGGAAVKPCDFNGDGLCNSFDWACSLSSFNKPEDPEPASP